MKIMTVCGNGLGTSMLVEMNIKRALKELGVSDIEVLHSDIASANTNDADIFFASIDLGQSVARLNPVFLNSLIDYEEIKEKVENSLKQKGHL